MTKFVKIQFSEEEFDEIMQYGLYDIVFVGHEKIMEHIRNKRETRYNGNNNRKQWI